MRHLAKIACAAAVALAVAGCANSPKGLRVVVSSSSTTNLGDVNWDEYKIPVFSIYSGPRLTVWVNKEYLAPSRLRAYGSVTNDVAALGIYASKESKTAGIDISFRVANTNGVAEIEAAEPKSAPANAVPVQMYLTTTPTNAPNVMLTNAES